MLSPLLKSSVVESTFLE